ncbi:SGNH/GDSL hydrolase family protein [Sphingomonas trueperi]|uniref:SGNH/GDSL hydrolase family protein n=1 Tax=Sphingomonas trueperi TaxID=53317 RepID=UPI001601D324
MVSSWSKRLALLAAGLSLQAVSAAPALAASAPRFTSTVEFGDSLVDAGNYYITSGGTYPDAAGGFFEGRNTNGYDYTDLLSQQITGTATVASLAGGTNYAFGGARVLGGGYPDFAAQIAQYQQHLAATGGKLDSHTLVSITFGDNDVGAIDNGDLGGFARARKRCKRSPAAMPRASRRWRTWGRATSCSPASSISTPRPPTSCRTC